MLFSRLITRCVALARHYSSSKIRFLVSPINSRALALLVTNYCRLEFVTRSRTKKQAMTTLSLSSEVENMPVCVCVRVLRKWLQLVVKANRS